MEGAAPRVTPAVGKEARLLGILGGLWLVPWGILSAAAWIAGGQPSASPLDFINPDHISKQLQADGHTVIPWHLVGALGPIRVWLFGLALGALCISALGALAWILISPHRSRLTGTRRDRRLLRASRWATRSDVQQMRAQRRRPGGFVLGSLGRTLIVTEPETSVLVIGPTRSGKTTGLVVPNLFDWNGPAIVTSTKSELVDITAAHRQSVGPVHIYDPTGEIKTRYPSVTWSPLSGCDDLDHAWVVAAWLCAGLQAGNSRGDNDWAHWTESGKLLVAPLLFAAANSDRSIVDVLNWIQSFDLVSPMALLEEMLIDAGDTASGDAGRALGMLMSVDQRPERERGTVFSTVARIFNVFNERAVADSALSCRFRAEEFLSRNGTLYLCTPRQSPDRIASLFVGILMSVVTTAYARADNGWNLQSSNPLGLFLDELANVVPIDDLASLASQGAGRGVLLMSIVQDLSQLRHRYGPDRALSILNNHVCKVVLSGISDPETADVLSRLIGRGDFTDVQINHGGDGRVAHSYSVKQDQIAPPEALRQLREGSAIVVHRGMPPTIVRLRPWYSSGRYRKLASRHFFRNAEWAVRAS